jgi:predicted nuclease with TOPRIM domain
MNDAETTEAARTLGNGSRNVKTKKSLPNMKVKTNESELKAEVTSLRAKNEEYRKALNIFREKLNEVAVFNSNLAYATRLFTEHSTTKQEKINILRRFDSVETLKESKTLYKTLKEEFDGKEVVVKESVEAKVQKSPSKGSATNLIESKTYENPQFLRMKDLMTKIIK